MKIIKKIKTAIANGSLLYWKGIRIAKIHLETMNLGGDVMVRFNKNKLKTKISIHEISILKKPEVVAKILKLEKKMFSAKNNEKRARRKLDSICKRDGFRVRPEFWEQVANDYAGEIRGLVIFHAKIYTQL